MPHREQRNSMRWIVLFFIAVPLIEMLLLFEVAEYIGGLWTIFLVVLTAVIGVNILKRQGFSTLLRANQRLDSGELPAQEVVEGLFLAFSGALLLTPGFITDTLGFLCLTTPLRRLLAAKLIASGLLMTVRSGSSRGFFYTSSRRPQSRTGNSSTIEGEFVKEEDYLSRQDDEEQPLKNRC